MDRKDILELAEKNRLAGIVRDNMNAKITASGNSARGAAIFIDNFGELTADVTFGDKDAAKEIGLYQISPEIDIPAVDKTGEIIYRTRKVIWNRKFQLLAKDYPSSRRTHVAREHYVTLYADGKHESTTYYQSTNQVYVFNPDQDLANNPSPVFVVDNAANYAYFVENFNGEVAKWSIPPLMRGLSISEGLEETLGRAIRVYLKNVSVRDVIESGLEGLQLTAKQFLTLIENSVTTYGWTNEERHDTFADDVLNIFGFRFANGGMFSVPTDIVKWDDPWDHPIWKDVPLISMMYQPNS